MNIFTYVCNQIGISQSAIHICKSVFALSFVRNSPNFLYGRMKQSEDAHACHVTPANGAIHIGTAWDGLFISVWAFGDASNKIDRTLSTLFCTIFRAK